MEAGSPSSDICELCGVVIDHAVFEQQGLFGQRVTCRQTKCGNCGFNESFRERKCVRRPFQIPALRPTTAGTAPLAYLQGLEHEKAQRMQSVEHGAAS